MGTESILLIIILWIAANGLFPLLLNSIERQYEKQIDSLARGVVSVLWWLVLRIVQLILVLVMLPSFLLITTVERIYPRALAMRYLADIHLTRRATLERDFPRTYVAAFRHIRSRGKST